MEATTIGISRAAKQGGSVSVPRKTGAASALTSLQRPAARSTVASTVLRSLQAGSKKMRPSALVAKLQSGDVPNVVGHKTEIIELLNMADFTSQIESAVEVDKPIFQPLPPVIQFSSYNAFEPVRAKILFRNNDRFARRMKVLPPDSPFFSIEGPFNTKGSALVDSRVAPGTELVYVVTFSPRDVDDYIFDLVCATEREKFVVPLKASGKRAVLMLPDSVSFPAVPVKSSASKTIVVRNAGNRGTEFRLVAPTCFIVSPTRAFVDVDDCIPVTIGFSPDAVQEYDADVTLVYAEGHSCLLQVSGSGIGIDVNLSSSEVSLDATYVSLSATAKVTLINSSDCPVEFSWHKLASNLLDEQEKVQDINDLLHRFEQESLVMMESKSKEAEDDFARHGDLMEDEDISPASSAAQRRLRADRQAIERKPLPFASKVFTISPMSGTLWSKSAIEFTVIFSPNDSKDFVETAFLDVTGQPSRLPLILRSTGIGPRLAFAYDVIDVGEVTVTSVHRYEVLLMNRGEISAEWFIGPSATPFGSRFLFDPPLGTLPVGDAAPISVYFTSDVLGPFSEVFEVRMKGCTAVLRVHFKGMVVPPAFAVDTRILEFGEVPFDFPQSRKITLTNESDVPFPFSFRIPADGKSDVKKKKEFTIVPWKGLLAPGEFVEVSIEFTSNTAKKYDGYELVMDVDRVGEALLRVPVVATCVVPSVSLVHDSVDFERCFVRHPYTRCLSLKNKDRHPARYHLIPQDEHSQVIALYSPSSMQGVVPASGCVDVEIQLTCYKVGPIVLPIFVSVAGSSSDSLKAELRASGKGPHVVCTPSPLSWGSIACLKSVTQSLQILNDSFIPAPISLSTRSAYKPTSSRCSARACIVWFADPRSKYTLQRHEALLAPGESINVPVVAFLDDAATCQDDLLVAVTESETQCVSLTARGTGHTIFCDPEIRDHDFGAMMTNVDATQIIKLENRGRRNQTVNWMNMTQRAREAEVKKGDKSKLAMSEKALASPFLVTPATCVVKPGQSVDFSVAARYDAPADISESLELQVRGESERNFSTIASMTLHATFVHPLLQFQPSAIDFLSLPDADSSRQHPLVQPVAIKNTSPVALTFSLSYVPASDINSVFGPAVQLSHGELILKAGEEVVVEASFDPTYRNDKKCFSVPGRLVASFSDHPHKDGIPCNASAQYPNVALDAVNVDFGCLLNDTVCSKIIRCVNTSDLESTFQWTLVEDEEAACREAKLADLPYIPINQVFDIRPFRFTLQPRESIPVEVSYFGHAGRRFQTTAVCCVVGGPEYTLSLSGEASVAAFRVDRQVLEFGSVVYDATESREFTLTNCGKVEYDFVVDIGSATSFIDILGSQAEPLPVLYGALFPKRLQISPSSGRIAAGDKARIVVKLCPGTPDPVHELVRVRIAHFEPIDIRVEAVGVFGNLLLALPRCDTTPDAWRSALTCAAGSLVTSSLNSSQAAPLGPPDVLSLAGDEIETRIQAEATRLLFRQHLALEAHKLPSASPRTKDVKLLQSIESVVMHSYVVDFGYVIQGFAKKQAFKVMNPGNFASAFALDKGVLFNSPFTVEPSKIPRLPEGASVDVDVTFDCRPGGMGPNSKGKEVPLGPYISEVPVRIAKGPAAMLLLKGIVTLPDVRISPDFLDFTGVLIGQEKEMCLQLHNVTAVPLQWGVVPPAIIALTNERDMFRVRPDSGSLAPGERCMLTVTYTPRDLRVLTVSIPIKILYNPKQRAFGVRGNGVIPAIRFLPADQAGDKVQECIALGPQLPCDRPSNKTVRVCNDSDFDVELYSVDFDAQLDEEEVLLGTDCNLFTEFSVARIPARQPGATLASLLSETPKDDQAIHGTGEGGFIDEAPRAPAASPRSQGRALNLLVTGPPFTGVSHVASVIASKLACKALTLNDIVSWCRSGAGGHSLALKVREYVKTWPIDNSSDTDTGKGTKPSTTGKKESKDAKSKGKFGELASTAYPRIPVMLLYECVMSRLQREDCGQAVVIDGLLCDYVNDGFESAVAVHYAFAGQRFPNSVVIALEADDSPARYLAALNQCSERLVDIDNRIVTLEMGGTKSKPPSQKGAKPPTGSKSAEDHATEPLFSEADKQRETMLLQEKRQIQQAINRLKRLAEGSSLDTTCVHDRRLMVNNIMSGYCVPPMPALPMMPVITVASPVKGAKGEGKKEEKEEEESRVFPSLSFPTEVGALKIPIHTFDVSTVNVDANISDVLPAVPEFSTPFNMDILLPAPRHFELIKKPAIPIPIRPTPALGNRFCVTKIEPPHAEVVADTSTDKQRPKSATAPSKVAALTKTSAPVELPAPKHTGEFDHSRKKQMRWVVPAKGQAEFCVQFAAASVGSYSATCTFAVVGCSKQFLLPVQGTCAVPTIAVDPRSVFMQRLKTRADNSFVCKKYVVARDCFEFGPVLLGRARSDRSMVHGDKWRFCNNGLFPVSFSLSLTGADNSTPWIRGLGPASSPVSTARPAEPQDKIPAVKSKDNPKDKEKDKESTESCFVIEPACIENLAPGETAEVSIFAFPGEGSLPVNVAGLAGVQLSNSIVMTIADNPEKHVFPLSCIGTIPQLELHGEWEHAVAKEGSPDLTKRDDRRDGSRKESAKVTRPGKPPTGESEPVGACLDFERQLVGKQEKKTFAILNSCLVPVRWRFDLSSVLASTIPAGAGKEKDKDKTVVSTEPATNAFRMSPIEGLLRPGESVPVDVTFGADVEIQRSHGIFVEFVDDELGFTDSETAAAAVASGDSKQQRVSTVKKGQGAESHSTARARVQRLPLLIKGEVYKVISGVKFEDVKDPESAKTGKQAVSAPSAIKASKADKADSPVMPLPAFGSFDFGSLRVGETSSKSIPLSNHGKYPISYKIAFAKNGEDVLSVSPLEGTLSPGQEVRVNVSFQAHQEIKFVNAKLLHLSIIDPQSLVVTDNIPVSISAETFFSQFSFSPSKCLNFGALRYGTDRERKIEIKNSGLFPLDFRLVLSGSSDDGALLEILDGKNQGSILQVSGTAAPSATSTSKANSKPAAPGKPADKKAATPLSAVEAAARNSDAPISEFGRFFVEPTYGTILPGASMQISVRFFACGAVTHKSVARIHVSNFDRLSGKPEQLLYELIGESCVPGINSTDFASIFEEQVVVPQLHLLGHIPYVGSTAGSSPESSMLFSRTRSGYGVEDGTFSFGSVVHSVHPKGVVERLCLSNPTKIPATVSLSIRADDSNTGIFQVSPQAIEVPAHESRYIELKFCPSAVKSYMATFLAEVEGGTIAATSKCQFHVRGDGALPTITCLEPESTQRSAVDGCLSATFARTHAGSKREKAVVVKNTGHFPAVVKVDLSPTRTFQLRLDGADLQESSAPLRSLSMTLQPGQMARLYVQFAPTTEAISGMDDLPGLMGVEEDGSVAYGVDATVSVLHNPFEVEKIRCNASTFIADLTFEGVSCTKDGEDALTLPPVCLGASTGQSTKTFSLINVCEHPIRFQWPHSAVTAPISFIPRIGHIPAGGRAPIATTFSPDESSPSSLTVENLAASLTYSRITYEPTVAKIASDERLKITAEGLAVNKGQPVVKVTGRAALPTKPKEPASKLVTKDTKVATKGPTTPAKKGDVLASPSGRRRPRMRSATVVSEPRIAWTYEDTSIAFVSIADPVAQTALNNGSGAMVAGGKEVKVSQHVPEPCFAVLALDEGVDEVAVFRPVPAAEEATALQAMHLKISALADRPRLEFVDETSARKTVNFLPTMMLQSRTMPVMVRNASRIPFNFSWDLAHATFSISPTTGLLEALSTTQFVAKFAPVDADDYDSVAPLLTTEFREQQLALVLHGRGQRPVCHIDVPPSDYLSHRAVDLPGPTGEVAPLDAATRVVEMNALGTGFRSVVKFFLVNPTATAYEFVWDAMNTTSAHSSRFRCLTPRGMVMPGKRFEMAFEFTPLAPITTEVFWRFSIPSCAISQQFLIVGLVREPRVALDRSFVSFRPLLVGARTSESLCLTNDEDIPLAYEILPLTDPVDRSSVTTALQSGIIPAKGKKQLELSFAPAEERYFNVSLQIAIARKSFPLVLNVKGDGYALHDKVTLEQTEGTMELSSVGVNYLDYGTVQVHERGIKRVLVTNTGSFAFDFTWSLVSKRGPGKHSPIRVTPETGKLPKGGQVVCEIEYKPMQEEVQSCTFACTIANTKKYLVQVAGKAVPAALQFSSDSIDFAQCFCPPLVSMPSLSVTKVLRVSNRERDRDISLQCLFTKKPYLEVLFDAGVIRAGQTVDIPVVFTPRLPQHYSETLMFEINGLQTVAVGMRGEGVAPAIDVYPASVAAGAGTLKEIAFGVVKPAQSTNRAFKLVNASSKAIWLEFVTPEQELTSKCISLSRKPFVIKAGEYALVDVGFSPSFRVAHFRLPLMVRMAAASGNTAASSLSEPWEAVVMTGACLGMDVSLEVDTVNFGLVCEGSRLTRQIMLYNNGDLPAVYKWRNEMLGKHFLIHPVSGVVGARSDVALYVTFAPKDVRPDLRADKVELAIEGMKHHLQLSATGDCVAKPAASGATINFACKVREACSQAVPLPRNDTDKSWTITPVISNDYWTGALSVEIPAKSTGAYTVTYRPLTMTREASAVASIPADAEMQIGLPTHSGSVFFPLPDGTGLTVALQGKAAAPSNVPQVAHKCLAKKPLTFSVPITNWLRSTQTFEISWDPKTIPAHAQLKAAKAVDVPGMASRDLKMTFMALLEGRVATSVLFTNPHTGEYVVNDILFEIGPAGITAELALESVVRQCVSTFITIENPLAESGAPVVFTALACDHPAIRIVKANEMTGQREGRFKIEYRPLVPTGAAGSRPGTAPTTSRPVSQPAAKGAGKPDKEKDKVDDKAVAAAASAAAASYARVTLHSDQLGDYLYDLKLKAVPAGSEPALRFNSQLGSRQTQQHKIKHYEFKAGNYKCSVSRPDLFSVPTSISVAAPATAAEAWDGVDGVIDVVFEGTSVGEASSELLVTSEASGTFVVPLIATCAEPRPTGPYLLAPAGSITVDFRNVFNDDREFFVSTDNPALFACLPVGITRIPKKSSISISIKYNGAAGSADASGRLAVSLAGAHDSPPWIFYLRGSSEAPATSGAKGARAPSAGRSGTNTAPKKK